jgi:poly(hydroxyalkanoate) depolymerase family esterase
MAPHGAGRAVVRAAAATALGACAAASGGGSGVATGGSVSPGALPGAPRVEQGSFGDGDAARGYTLVVPAAVAAGARPAGLLVFLHGCTQDAADARRGTRLDEAAERAGLLVLYPEQTAAANPQRCWNWFDPAHQRRDAGEPATLAGMTESVARAHGVEPARVHVAGISAGGAMALVLAAHYPERFATVASHSGVAPGVARTPGEAWQVMRAPKTADAAVVRQAMGARARTVPLLVVHGSADAVVAVGNADALAVQWAEALGATLDPATPAAATVAAAAGDGRPTRERRWSIGGAPAVRLVVIDGLGHAWSGGSPAGTYSDPRGPSAAELVVAHAVGHARAAERP